MRCHGSYMSLFDAWISAIAMFNLGQMNVLLRKAWLCSRMLPVWQPSSVFFLSDTLLLICAVIVALGVLSSADRWAQLWTSMHGTSMYVCTGTLCYVTPVCGMFVFGDTMYMLLCLAMDWLLREWHAWMTLFKHVLS